MESIKDSLTFDDVSLVPQHSSIVPNETITSVELFKNLKLISLVCGKAVLSVATDEICVFAFASEV